MLQSFGLERLGVEAQYVILPVLALVALAALRFFIHRVFGRWAKRTQTELDNRLVAAIESTSTPLLLVTALYLTTFWFPLEPDVLSWIQRGIGILAVILVVPMTSKIISILLEMLSTRQPGAGRFVQPLRTLANALLVLAAIAASLKILNVNLSDEGVRLVRVIGIAFGCYVTIKIVGLGVASMQRLVDSGNADIQSEAEKRAQTLGRIIKSAAAVLVVGVGLMMILSEFGMNIAPIITGAGVAGLAVGFGAQNLVRDVISGFFLILEDQIRVGDVAIINGTGGFVEAIRLRTIVLRDMQGVVHIIPNGQINQVSNMTKEWSRYVIDLRIPYKENVDHVMKVLVGVGEDIYSDEKYRPLILEPLEIVGVDDFAESNVTIKIMIKTLPLKQWAVGRELRRRIKNTFDREGLAMAFPHMSVYFGDASKPFEVLLNPELREKAQTHAAK